MDSFLSPFHSAVGPSLNSLFWFIYCLFLKFSFDSSSYLLFLCWNFLFFSLCYKHFWNYLTNWFYDCCLKTLIRYFNMSVMLVLVSVDQPASWKLRFSWFLVWWEIFYSNLGHFGFCFVRPWILFNLFIFWKEATLFTVYVQSEGLRGMKAQFTIL